MFLSIKAGLQVAVPSMGDMPSSLESSAGLHCVILSPRDYSDLKRLRCLLNVQSSKQQVGFSKKVWTSIKRESRVSKGIHSTALWMICLLLFFLLHILSFFTQLFLSYLPRLGGIRSLFILLLSGLGPALFYACCHVSSLPKLSGLETACLLLNARCSSLQSFGASDFFKTLFTTFPFFSSSPPSCCPPATATLLRIAANCLLLKRGERSEFGLFLS